ncbi:ARM repeat-containing protein [Ramicandelaber brevisporus]|nr:ARM repeat-containing protein [Ramicandelaber brevisporus]
MDRAKDRRDAFKSKGAFKADDVRRRREEQAVEIRRQKRDETLSKKRMTTVDPSAVSDSEDEEAAANQIMRKLNENLPKMLEEIYSSNVDQQLQAATLFRKLLSKERQPPIGEIIATGVVPRLVELLGSQHQLVVFESAWALTNIASGTSSETATVVNAGAIPRFVELLSHPSADVREQAVWALGNIAGDSTSFRDQALQSGAMQPLCALLLSSNSKQALLRNATWSLSNLCRGKNPAPSWDMIEPALPVFARLIYIEDGEILTDACWALSYLTDGANDKIQSVIEAGVCRRLVELMMHPSSNVQTPALRTIGNIVTGDDQQTQAVINAGVIPALLHLLASPREGIRKEAAWTISNITAGTPDQIQAVINGNLIPPLIYVLANGDFKSRKEACWAISNATSGGLNRPEQIRYLVQQGCIAPLCELIGCMDNRIIQIALDGIENILKVGEMDKDQGATTSGINDYALYVEECGGMEKIHNLQLHENTAIYKKAYAIIDKYFGGDEDEEGAGNQFANAAVGQDGQFGMNVDSSVPQGGFNFGGGDMMEE